MKRTVQMKNAGIPKAGQMRPGHFLGFRRPHWHETAHVVGRDQNDLPIIEWTEQAVKVIRPAWHTRRALEQGR